ncbi:MAG: hypothetical protein LBE34_13950 [Flavobacteriaceae bacterium]|jgi:hypothetical protein|nr:hypothetical protein [Flavobacteriaceae bacterium]
MGDIVRGSRFIKIKEKVKSVKIIATGTQFQNATPANITLKATAINFEADLYRWYNSAGAIIGNTQNFIIANNQVTTVNSYRVEVTDLQGNVYQDVISITKVQDGQIGKQGRVPIQREWTTGDIYRNNDQVIDYIYHRATNTWWRLKDGYDNITATANPDNRFIQLTNVEQMAVNLLIAENANIGGLIFKDEKLVSQTLASDGNPNLLLDGKKGELKCYKIEAKGGAVGALEIGTNGLTYRHDSVLAGNYAKRYNIDMRFADNSQATIGSDAIFLLSGYAKGLGTFVCSYDRSSDSNYNTKPGHVGFTISPMNVGLLLSAKGATRNHAIKIIAGDIAGNALYTKYYGVVDSIIMTDESVAIYSPVNYKWVCHIELPKGVDRWDGRIVEIMCAGSGFTKIYGMDAVIYSHEGHHSLGQPNNGLAYDYFSTKLKLVYVAEKNWWFVISLNVH